MKIAKDILSTTSLSYLTLIANYVFATLVIRNSGDSLYGDMVLLMTLQTVVLTTLSMGLPLNILRYKGANLNQIVAPYLELCGIVTVICFVSYYLYSGSPDNSVLVLLLVVGSLTTYLAALQPLFQLKNIFVKHQIYTFVFSAFKVILVAGLYYIFTSVSPQKSSMLIYVALGLMLVFLYSKEGFYKFSYKDRLNFKKLYEYKNIALWISALSVIVYSRVDILMLPLFSVTKAEIGTYAYVYGFFSAILLLPTVIQNLLLKPLFDQSIDGTKTLKHAFKSYIPISFFIFIVFMILLPPIINWLIMKDTQLIVRAMAPAIPIVFVTNLLGLGLLTLKLDKQRTRAQLIAAVSNIILNFILIPKLSILGAAMATTISYFLLYLLFLIECVKTNVWNIKQYKLMLTCLTLVFLALLVMCFY